MPTEAEKRRAKPSSGAYSAKLKALQRSIDGINLQIATASTDKQKKELKRLLDLSRNRLKVLNDRMREAGLKVPKDA